MAMQGDTMFDTWKQHRMAYKSAKTAYKKYGKESGKRPGKYYAFADGSSGVGRYNRRRFGVSRGRFPRRSYRRYRGRGGYWDDAFSWAGKKLGLGADAGKGIGQSIWNLGTGMVPGGRAASTALGFGAYKRGYGAYGDAEAPAVMDQDVPIVSNPHGADGAIVISHREFICDVATTGSAFAIIKNLAINPGCRRSFPWLSTVALNFTQYRFEGLIFKFVSTSGALSTTQALGEIIMAANYDPNQPSFSNKQQMLNEVMAVSRVPSNDAECGIECNPAQTAGTGLLYIRSDALPVGKDPRFYDLCNFTAATQGQSSAVTLGELWVTYQVALYKPSLPVTYTETSEYNANFVAGSTIPWIMKQNDLQLLATQQPGNDAITLFSFPLAQIGDLIRVSVFTTESVFDGLSTSLICSTLSAGFAFTPVFPEVGVNTGFSITPTVGSNTPSSLCSFMFVCTGLNPHVGFMKGLTCAAGTALGMNLIISQVK